jgi:hypothetical protein
LEYYPVLFFSLTDIITYFGQLVYDRLGITYSVQVFTFEIWI